MVSGEYLKDRRKHKRYAVKEGAFSAIASYNLLGQIKNISKGGLAFCCRASGKQNFYLANMDIFTNNTDFYLNALPFKIISDFELENQEPSSLFKMRKLGGQFVKMTEHQISLLDDFIQNYTLANAR